jgi:hypothetical protein
LPCADFLGTFVIVVIAALSRNLPKTSKVFEMENSTITLLIRYFNILSTTVMAFFAVYGVIAVFGKKSNLNIFRRNLFVQAFCVASLFAFVLEATLFNFQHYLKYFADGEVHTLGVSPQDSTVILTSDGTVAEMFFEKEAVAAARDSAADAASGNAALTETPFKEKDSIASLGGIRFKNLNRRITSIYIEPVFDSAESITAIIKDTDKSSTHIIKNSIYRGLPHTNHIQYQLCGNVSALEIVLAGTNNTGASQIAINRQIPLYFSGLRLFTVTFLFFTVILFAYKPFRAKMAYLLFEYRFEPASKKQNIIYAFSVMSLILFSWVCAYTSVVEERVQAKQYNKYLVDALIAGRTDLEAGNPEKMLNAERPYDLKWLDENGYERDAEWFADWAYYKGKFYCYFGLVPALMLYVPYNLITGNYLSNHGGIFIFAALSIILLARLWRFLVKKYMPNALFMFYLLSFFTIFFASGWFCPLRFTRFYSIVSAAGFMFVIAGVLLLLESVENEKPDRSKLFFACACFALAVGCRPHLLLASLIVPVILWRHKLWKYLPLTAIPYIAAAIPMCVYNYARFGSIFDFGFNYNMTNLNTAAYSLLNPIGKMMNIVGASLSYLFSVNKYSLFFPYVESSTGSNFLWPIVKFYDRGCGMLNFPIVFCLFFFFKSIIIKQERPKTFYISAVFLAISAALIFINSYLVGFSGRYTLDFAVFIILPSLFCAYHRCVGNGGTDFQPSENQNRVPVRVRQKVVYVLLVFSIFVGLFLFATTVTNDATPGSPVLYRYLRQSLALLGVV